MLLLGLIIGILAGITGMLIYKNNKEVMLRNIIKKLENEKGTITTTPTSPQATKPVPNYDPYEK